MNVTELYRELKMTKDEFFATVQELGFDIGERAIKIDDSVAVKVIQAIKAQRKKGQKKSIFAEEEKKETPTTTEGNILKVPDKISVKQFAEKLNKRVPDMIAILMRNGIMATINETLDYETAAIIAEDLGYTPQLSLEDAQIDNPADRSHIVAETLQSEKQESLQPRPPVVVIMGHVDHGKTTLLDTIRTTHVTEQESGGITQHIGAYQVRKKERDITFIDTPGHEAFTAMRSRGARVADVAILVTAADDSIQPQTIEAIHIIQEAKLPFVVAINKIDKPQADIDRVKKELSELNLIPEDYGGKTICVPISAKEGTNIDELLETLLLVADLEKEHIVANPEGATVGSIIEAHVDTHTGPVATVLIQNGTLRIGDLVQIGNIPGRIRSLRDWQGKELEEAAPSVPAQVLGLKKAPIVGDILQVVHDKKALKKNVKAYDSFTFLNTKKQDDEDRKKFTVILRGDTLGSLEAIIQSLQDIKHEEVVLNILHKGLGAITENDVHLAQTSGATIMGFHVNITSGAEKYAKDEGIPFEMFDVIYKLIDYAKEELQKLLSKEISYEQSGSLRVLAVFRRTQNHSIVGGKVEEGKIRAHAPLKILRKGKMVGEGTLTQLQKDKKNIGEVTSGSECGLRIETDTEIQEGDTVETYEMHEKERAL